MEEKYTSIRKSNKLTKRTIVSSVIILILIPLTILYGIYGLDDRKYVFISLIIIFLTMVPFLMVFEGRKPQAREIVLIAVLSAIAVAGRGAFFMIPQFKPVVAIVIITGVCLGGEAGFLVGTVTGFVSNFFFGQGPWTVWQMFCFGIIGFLAGVLFQKGLLKKNKIHLLIYGFLSTLIIYGGIIDFGSMMMMSGKFNLKLLLTFYVSGFWFNVIHAVSTVFFLFILSDAMIEKIDRIKIKYGLIQLDT